MTDYESYDRLWELWLAMTGYESFPHWFNLWSFNTFLSKIYHFIGMELNELKTYTFYEHFLL